MNQEREPCNRCGKPTFERLEISVEGSAVTSHPLCLDCQRTTLGGFRRCQDEFQVLIGRGVHRKIANRIMCRRIAEGEFA